MTTLDVGQGLSMVVRTRNHVLVFDTGPAFRNGGDTGQLVLVPYLRAAGIRRVDLLMVSHADSDHAGGAASLDSAMPVERMLSGGFIDGVAGMQRRCRRGHAWLWDGVRFSVMHPVRAAGAGRPRSDNDESCVLEIAAGPHRALLTGDIEKAAEKRLLESGSLSDVRLVVVPHHGSLTSSSDPFVRRLKPDVALVSAGFDNRWGLPRAAIVERWERSGARVLNTATSGAIRARMCADTGLDAVTGHRDVARKYWHRAGR
jgi:competence protein ComEC